MIMSASRVQGGRSLGDLAATHAFKIGVPAAFRRSVFRLQYFWATDLQGNIGAQINILGPKPYSNY